MNAIRGDGDNGNLISGIESARKGAARIDILTATQKTARGRRIHGVVPLQQKAVQLLEAEATATMLSSVKNNKHCDSNKISQKLVSWRTWRCLYRLMLNWSCLCCCCCYRKIQSKRNENQANTRQLCLHSLLTPFTHTHTVDSVGCWCYSGK